MSNAISESNSRAALAEFIVSPMPIDRQGGWVPAMSAVTSTLPAIVLSCVPINLDAADPMLGCHCTSCRHAYSAEQLEYHYTKSKAVLAKAIDDMLREQQQQQQQQMS
jgi:hypothetical protein